MTKPITRMPALFSSAPSNSAISYQDAGVDIEAGEAFVKRIKPMLKRTQREGVLGGLGDFGALFEIPKRYRSPVLVSGTDGVGTKIKLAFAWNMHTTIGIDLVAMSVNDILVQGANPLFFLDYFACGKLDIDTATTVVEGIASGCEQAGCALVGGETAEMPDMYPEGEYDLAGFAVGAVERSRILSGASIQAGDIVLGLPSSGAHANGYSLVRRLIEREHANLPSHLDGKPFRQAIMEPTRIYVKPILAALNQFNIQGIAHITGGGLTGNIPRILPQQCSLVLYQDAWPQSELFAWLQRCSGLDNTQMQRTFNCGIGLALVLRPQDSANVTAWMGEQGLPSFIIGHIA